jgi:hypothetical protein
VSDEQIQDVEQWLLSILKSHSPVSASELIQLAGDSAHHFSPNAITWAVWYLVSEGKLNITRDDLVAAA